MKRIREHPLAFLVALACLAPGIAAAKSSSVPLPDRNPERPVEAAEQPGAPAPETPETTDVAAIPEPERNPQIPSSSQTEAAQDADEDTADTSESSESDETTQTEEATTAEDTEDGAEAQAETADVPLPTVKPNRNAPADQSTKKPGPDYASILKPLLSYDISSDDESRLKFVMQSKGTVEETSAKISDPARLRALVPLQASEEHGAGRRGGRAVSPDPSRLARSRRPA
jgi:hypothetical protein